MKQYLTDIDFILDLKHNNCNEIENLSHDTIIYILKRLKKIMSQSDYKIVFETLVNKKIISPHHIDNPEINLTYPKTGFYQILQYWSSVKRT